MVTAGRKKSPSKKGRAAKRPNPYAAMSDDELACAWERMLDEYVDRMEYFAALPEWQNPSNLNTIKQDPGAWGLSRGELQDWCAVLLEHITAGFDMGDAVTERHRRLYEAERRRAAAVPYADALAEIERPSTALQGPFATWKLETETMRKYVRRREEEADRLYRHFGERQGYCDVLEEWWHEVGLSEGSMRKRG